MVKTASHTQPVKPQRCLKLNPNLKPKPNPKRDPDSDIKKSFLHSEFHKSAVMAPENKGTGPSCTDCPPLTKALTLSVSSQSPRRTEPFRRQAPIRANSGRHPPGGGLEPTINQSVPGRNQQVTVPGVRTRLRERNDPALGRFCHLSRERQRSHRSPHSVQRPWGWGLSEKERAAGPRPVTPRLAVGVRDQRRGFTWRPPGGGTVSCKTHHLLFLYKKMCTPHPTRPPPRRCPTTPTHPPTLKPGVK